MEHRVECNGWGQRHVEVYPTREAAEKRVAQGYGNPVLLENEGGE